MKRSHVYRLTRRSFVGALIFTLGIALFSGCAHEPETITAVPITDIRSVAGRWEGMVERPGQRDWVEMVIQDDGAYWIRSYRGIGTYNGKGVFSVVDGKLTSRSEKGSATYILHQNHGEDVLSLNVTLNEQTYSGHFSLAKK